MSGVGRQNPPRFERNEKSVAGETNARLQVNVVRNAGVQIKSAGACGGVFRDDGVRMFFQYADLHDGSCKLVGPLLASRLPPENQWSGPIDR